MRLSSDRQEPNKDETGLTRDRREKIRAVFYRGKKELKKETKQSAKTTQIVIVTAIGTIIITLLIAFFAGLFSSKQPTYGANSNTTTNANTNTNVVKTKEQLDREKLFDKFQDYVTKHYGKNWIVSSFRQEDIPTVANANTNTKKPPYYLMLTEEDKLEKEKVILVQEADFMNVDGSTEELLYEPFGTKAPKENDEREYEPDTE